jgi:hypothetical protein
MVRFAKKAQASRRSLRGTVLTSHAALLSTTSTAAAISGRTGAYVLAIVAAAVWRYVARRARRTKSAPTNRSSFTPSRTRNRLCACEPNPYERPSLPASEPQDIDAPDACHMRNIARQTLHALTTPNASALTSVFPARLLSWLPARRSGTVLAHARAVAYNFPRPSVTDRAPRRAFAAVLRHRSSISRRQLIRRGASWISIPYACSS